MMSCELFVYKNKYHGPENRSLWDTLSFFNDEDVDVPIRVVFPLLVSSFETNLVHLLMFLATEAYLTG